jgi:hypothetical protein
LNVRPVEPEGEVAEFVAEDPHFAAGHHLKIT